MNATTTTTRKTRTAKTPKTTKAAKTPKTAKAAKKATKAPVTGPTSSKLTVIPILRRDGDESRSITRGAVVAHYVVGAGRTPSGRKSFDVNDEIAALLRGKTTEELFAVTAKQLSKITGETIKPADLEAKYGHLNPGQIRMNCGNRLRAAYKADAEAESEE